MQTTPTRRPTPTLDATFLRALADMMAEVDLSTPIVDNADALYRQATGDEPPHVNPAGKQADLLVAYARAGFIAGLVYADQQKEG